MSLFVEGFASLLLRCLVAAAARARYRTCSPSPAAPRPLSTPWIPLISRRYYSSSNEDSRTCCPILCRPCRSRPTSRSMECRVLLRDLRWRPSCERMSPSCVSMSMTPSLTPCTHRTLHCCSISRSIIIIIIIIHQLGTQECPPILSSRDAHGARSRIPVRVEPLQPHLHVSPASKHLRHACVPDRLLSVGEPARECHHVDDHEQPRSSSGTVPLGARDLRRQRLRVSELVLRHSDQSSIKSSIQSSIHSTMHQRFTNAMMDSFIGPNIDS